MYLLWLDIYQKISFKSNEKPLILIIYYMSAIVQNIFHVWIHLENI